MNKKISPALIGGFVLGGIIIAIIGLVLFGGGKFFEHKLYCVLFFEESLSGLDVGAPVEYKGVRIGTVSDVRLIIDRSTETILRPVTLSIEPKRTYLGSGKRTTEFSDDGIKQIIERGLRARLASQSILTGKLKIELDFFPDTPVKLVDSFNDLPQLPTVLSPLAAAKEKLGALPFEEVVLEVRNLLLNASKIVASKDAQSLLPELNKTLLDVQMLTDNLNKQIEPLGKNLDTMSATGKKTLDEMTRTIDNLSKLMDPLLKQLTQATTRFSDTFDERSSMMIEIEELINNVSRASQSFADLSDFLQRHPEALLRGKGGSQ